MAFFGEMKKLLTSGEWSFRRSMQRTFLLNSGCIEMRRTAGRSSSGGWIAKTPINTSVKDFDIIKAYTSRHELKEDGMEEGEKAGFKNFPQCRTQSDPNG